MPQSFALRIESGEQAGQTHAIPSKGLTVGRRPQNDLVIQDASVSGRHARFSIEGDHVVLVDLASTNGSFVDDQKVDEARLEAGAFLRLGKVELELITVSAGAAAPTAPAAPAAPQATAMPAAPPPPRAKPAPVVDELELELDDDGELELELEDPADSGADLQIEDPVDERPAEPVETLDLSGFDDDQDGMHAVDEAALAKSKGGSKAPALVGLVLLAGAAGWYFAGMPGLPSDGGSGGAPERPVVSVAGNTLTNPSFEDDLTGWRADEGAGLVPFTDAAWRSSGAVGIGNAFEAGEAARLTSAPVKLGGQRNLKVAAEGAADGGASARVGLAFSHSAGDQPPVTAWSAALSGGEDEVGFEAWAPAGYDRVEVVLELAAKDAPGSAGFDDVSLVLASGAAPGATVGDFQLTPAGDGRLALAFIDRPLLVDFAAREPRTVDGDLAANVSGGFSAIVPASQMQGGLATLGAGGFAPHGDEFEDAGVTSIVIGQGVSQLRLVLPAAATVSGRPVTGGFRIEAVNASGTLRIETGFADERAQAARFAQEARSAEERGHRGEALQNWQALLDDVPFDQELVQTAEQNRGRLITAGLEDLAALADDHERATFFGLADLFHACLEDVRALEVEFAGSEVETAAAALAAEVEASIAGLDGAGVDEDRLHAARSAVRSWANESGAETLLNHMQDALKGND